MREAAIIRSLPIILYLEHEHCSPRVPRFVGGNFDAVTGFPFEEVEANPTLWADRLHPDDRDRALTALEKRKQTGAMAIEYRWQCADGNYRHFLDQAVLLPATAGEAAEYAGTLIDVSERKHLEAQLLQAGKLDAIGQLTGGVAHDFNNLLAAVLGGINLLERRVDFAARELTILQQMRHAAENGAELVRRMMAFARKQELHPVSTSPEGLRRSVSGLLQPTLGGTFDIAWHCDGAARNFYVDDSQLELAVVNLIINARDSMPGGGTIEVHVDDVSIEEATAIGLKPGEYLRLRVTDRGVGIPENLIDRIVEPFFTTKEVGKGTGLGLSMVAGFVQQSGGKLAISSQPGVGTTIELHLPATAEAARVAQEEEAPQANGNVARRSILLVDDDDTVREILSEQLVDMNLDVVSVADGFSALKVLEDPAHHFDVLLTDFAMPGIDGSETIIRARKIKPDIQALLMTGYADDSIISDKLGMTPVLRKPINPAALQKALQ
jgi:PAS domain S-box-containing protein